MADKPVAGTGVAAGKAAAGTPAADTEAAGKATAGMAADIAADTAGDPEPAGADSLVCR